MYPLVAGTISRSLGQICDVLHDLPDSPRTQELARRARAYAKLLDGWTRSPPVDAQQEALLDCVMALHAEVVGSSGTYLAAGVAEPATVEVPRGLERSAS